MASKRTGKTITVCCDNHANIHSKRKEDVTFQDLGITDDEWRELSDDEKNKIVVEHIQSDGWIDIWFEEHN